MSLLRIKEHDHNEKRIFFWCPACNMLHSVSVGREGWSAWTWNGSERRPTFSPSVHLWRDYELAGKRIQDVCHFFVRDGNIEYLDDCTHRLKGKSVRMVNIPADVFIS